MKRKPVAVAERKPQAVEAAVYQQPPMNQTQQIRARSNSSQFVNINVYEDAAQEKLGASALTDFVKGNHKAAGRESQMAESTRSSHDELSQVGKTEDGDERKLDTNSHVGVDLFPGPRGRV